MSLHGFLLLLFVPVDIESELVCMDDNELMFLLCRGTFQPYCRSLPEDPFFECFEPCGDSDIQGLFGFLRMKT